MRKAWIAALLLSLTGCGTARTVITVQPDQQNPHRVTWQVSVIVP